MQSNSNWAFKQTLDVRHLLIDLEVKYPAFDNELLLRFYFTRRLT